MKYLEWCDRQGVPEIDRCPVRSDVVLEYVYTLAGTMRASTIGHKVAALQAWQSLWMIPWTVSASLLSCVTKAAEALQPDGRPSRPPVLVDDLRCFLATVDLSSPFDVACAACATIAFWGMIRLGNLAFRSATGKETWDAAFNPSKAHAVIRPSEGGTPARIDLFVPYDKVEHHRGITITVAAQESEPMLDPLLWLRVHWALNGRSASEGLFSYRATKAAEVGLRVLTKKAMLERFNRALDAAGRDPIDGHSFRIGGATTYLLAQCAPEHVKVAGHWKSDAFLLYWRELPTLTARALGNLAPVLLRAL